MRPNALTVGELAQQTGLSVRTLRYYDEVGLLKPSSRTGAGYRVYAPGDLGRLQQVLMLRQLGFSLAEVRQRLEAPDFSPPELLHLYITRLREHIELQHGLCERLATVPYAVGEVGVDESLKTIRGMISIDSHRGP